MSTTSSALINSSHSVNRFGFNSTAAAESAIAFLEALIEYGGVLTASPFESSSPGGDLPQTVVEQLAEWEMVMNPQRLDFLEFDRTPHLWLAAVWDDEELLAAISLTASLGWVLRFLGAESLCGQNLKILDRVKGLRLANPLAHAIWDSANTLLGNRTSSPLPPIFVPPVPCNLSEASLAAEATLIEIWHIQKNMIKHANQDIRQDAYIFWRLGNLEWLHRRMPETGYQPCYSEVWAEDGMNSLCAHEASITLKERLFSRTIDIGQRLRHPRNTFAYAGRYPRDIPLWTPNARVRAAELMANFNINMPRWAAKLRIESAKLNCAGVVDEVARWERFMRRPRLGWIGIDPTLDVEASGLSCKVILGTTATICPTANPQLPDANLQFAERAIRELYGLPNGSTIHWVGHDAGARGLCHCHPGAPFVGSLHDLPHGMSRSFGEFRGLIEESHTGGRQPDAIASQPELVGVLPQSGKSDSSAAGNQAATPNPDHPADTQDNASGPDGLFDADGFRFSGVEVRFGRAVLRYRLVQSLWDVATHAPTPPRPVEDVIDDVYGVNHQTEDRAFRKLVSETRGKLESQNCPLNLKCLQGTIQLIPVE